MRWDHQHHARELLTSPPGPWWQWSPNSTPGLGPGLDKSSTHLETPEARSAPPLPIAARHPPPQIWAGSRSLIKALQVTQHPEFCFMPIAGPAAIHLPKFCQDRESRLGGGGMGHKAGGAMGSYPRLRPGSANIIPFPVGERKVTRRPGKTATLDRGGGSLRTVNIRLELWKDRV